MTALCFAEFDRLYQRAVDGVFAHWTPEMQQEIAVHNVAWGAPYDFGNYLRLSNKRYYLAYTSLLAHGQPGTICDVGGLWGVWPVTLRQLGFDVTMTEALQYYGAAFDGLFAHIRAQGVTIRDYDPFAIDAEAIGPFDAITVMAVLEHYPHSLQTFMNNTRRSLASNGLLYVEVPNIAYWPKRMQLLRGQSPLPPLLDIYRSKVPFTGHHHEFTMAELRTLMAQSDFEILAEHWFNYSSPDLNWHQKLRYRPLDNLAYALLPDSREIIAALCRILAQ